MGELLDAIEGKVVDIEAINFATKCEDESNDDRAKYLCTFIYKSIILVWGSLK